MRSSDPDLRLPERAETMLEGWPAPSRGALEWEEAASGIMDRVRSTAMGSTPDDLLAPPLSAEPGEGSTGGAVLTAVVDMDEPRLADIARAAVADLESNPAQDVARAGLLAAERDRGVRDPAPVRSPQGSAVASLQSRVIPAPPSRAAPLEPVTAMHAPAESDVPPPRARETSGPGFGAGLMGGAAIAFAAAAALYLSVQHRETERLLSATSSEHTAPPPRALPTPASARAPDVTPAPLALEELPSVSRGGSTGSKSAPEASGASTESLAFRVKPAAKGSSSKMVLEQRSDEAAPAAPPAAAPTVAPEKQTEHGVPAQPSLGALQAALGTVTTGARSCLAGQETGSKATVVFGSDGRVTSVTLSGPAAGTPAEPCVRSALSAARVPPFGDASYSVALPIRPP